MVMVDEGLMMAFATWLTSSLLVPTVVDRVSDEPRLPPPEPLLAQYRLLSLCWRSLEDKSELLKLLLLSRRVLLQLQLAAAPAAPDFESARWPGENDLDLDDKDDVEADEEEDVVLALDELSESVDEVREDEDE